MPDGTVDTSFFRLVAEPTITAYRDPRRRHGRARTPQESLADVDLYTERGRFVMFNYTDDTVTTISIAHVPAGD